LRSSENHFLGRRSSRRLAWPLALAWLFSSFVQAANCCCGATAQSHTEGAASVLARGDGPAHSHRGAHSAAVDQIDVDDAPGHSDPGCSEVKAPDASLQSKHVVYGFLDQPGPVRVEVVDARACTPTVRAVLRPSGLLPPFLNPFLSTVRLLL